MATAEVEVEDVREVGPVRMVTLHKTTMEIL